MVTRAIRPNSPTSKSETLASDPPGGVIADGDTGATSGTFGFFDGAGQLSGRIAQTGKGHAVVQAYILVQTEVGKAAAVAAEIAGLTGVISAEDVTGPYDVIVRAESEDVDALGTLVVARVQGVNGITRTLTCPVVRLG